MPYFDDEGLFWVGETRQKEMRDAATRRNEFVKQLRALGEGPSYTPPPLPVIPAGPIAIDFETDDPDLMTRGSSWAFPGNGSIVGVAAAFNGFSAYYPIGHRSGNVDSGPVIQWLIDLWQRDDVILVMANANYDIGWARRELDRYPRGKISDVQHIAALINELQMSYSLDNLSKQYLGAGKDTSTLHTLETRLAIRHDELMGALKEIPAGYVAEYARVDALRTIDLYNLLRPQLAAQKLEEIYEVEEELIPMSVEMRRIGIRVDLARAQELHDEIIHVMIPEITRKIKHATGTEVQPWVNETVSNALRAVGIEPAKTDKGADSVTAPFLAEHARSSDVAADILSLRRMSKVASTFLKGHIVEHHVNGRIHAEFNQLRSEQVNWGDRNFVIGTVTGRYSSSQPNLQQIPNRDKQWGPAVRSLFLPEDGEELLAVDYASQEPRLAVHFAAKAGIKGADRVTQAYKDNPHLDFHQFVADDCGIDRGLAKTLNLGLSYGLSSAHLADALGLPTKHMIPSNDGSPWIEITPEVAAERRSRGLPAVRVAGLEARTIIKKWEERAPFMRGLFNMAEKTASERGFIITLLKRRCRFRTSGDKFIFTHAAMNRLCQSSAADQLKKAMLALWRENIVPRITVHDELVFSLANSKTIPQIRELMQEAVTLEVPTVVDIKRGSNWGSMQKEPA